MKKLNLLIAALHASALALGAFPGAGHAQDANEVRAYMEALAVGTPEALQAFLQAYPNSALPGSELGATIAASLDQPTSAVGNGHGREGGNSGHGVGNGGGDGSHGRGHGGPNDDGIY